MLYSVLVVDYMFFLFFLLVLVPDNNVHMVTSSTGGIGSVSWRITPNPSPDASNAGAKYHWGGSITATTRQRNISRGGKGVPGARP